MNCFIMCIFFSFTLDPQLEVTCIPVDTKKHIDYMISELGQKPGTVKVWEDGDLTESYAYGASAKCTPYTEHHVEIMIGAIGGDPTPPACY